LNFVDHKYSETQKDESQTTAQHREKITARLGQNVFLGKHYIDLLLITLIKNQTKQKQPKPI